MSTMQLAAETDRSLPTVEVVGGTAGVVQGSSDICVGLGLQLASPGQVRIVMDLPTTFAFATLMHEQSSQPTVVCTWNRSLAYCADLWDLRPTVLLAGPAPDLVAATCAAHRNDTYCEAALDQRQHPSADHQRPVR